MSASSTDFPDRGPAVFAVTTATLVLGSCFVFARMVCRLGIVHRTGWDDYFIVLAWLLAFALSLTINLGTRNGLGRHDENIPLDDWAKLRRCEYVFSILYNPALMATKTSILIFYLRLSKNTQELLRFGSYVVLAIVNIAGIVLTFLNIFQCRPVAAAFSNVPGGQCIPLLTEFICSAPVNIITDLAILALPIPVLTGMRLPSRQKTILILTFALGIFVTVVDVVRIYYLQQAINVVHTGSSSDPNSIFGDGADFSWNASLSLMWSAVEVNVGITCACIPTLKPLIIKIIPSMLVDPDGSSYDSSQARDLDFSETTSRRGTARPSTAPLQPEFIKADAAAPEVATASNTAITPAAGRPPHTRPAQAAQDDEILPNPAGLDASSSSSHNMDLDLDSSFDLGVGPRPDLTLNRIATADHAQDLPSLSPAASRRRQQEADDRGPVNPASPKGPTAPHSPLARVASSTRHAFATFLHLSTAGSTKSPRRSREKSVYFGFVNLHTPKNMLEASVSESFKYCTIVAVLFFLWGFSYGLLNTLNNVVAAVANMTTAQTLGLTSAYFGGGYFFGPLLVGEWVLRHDEHRRWRGSGIRRHTPHREGRPGSLASVQAAPATVASAADLAVTNRSRHSESSENPVGGFKATFMTGLCFYGIGTMMFWPSAVLTSFPGFLISSFVVGFGLSVLETAANPFIALCGPLEYSEMRLLIVQGAQGVGSVLSGLLAQNVFFVDVDTASRANSTTLLDVQWTYLAITLFCVSLAMFFYYIPLPEVHDAELEQAASRLPVDGKKRSLFGLQLRTVCLILAVFAQWTYVASQESMSIYFHHLITAWLPSGAQTGSSSLSSPPASVLLDMATSSITPSDNSDDPVGLSVSVPNYVLISRTAFTVSRFFTGYIVYLGVKHPRNRWLPTPRTILAMSTILMALFALLTVVLRPSRNANLIMVPVTLYFLAEGPIWPLIFSIGLRGQGTRTKRAAAFITMGASGPLFWPFVMYAIIERGGNIQIAFVIVVVLMAACAIYPLYLTFADDARELTKVAPLDPQAAKAELRPGTGPHVGSGVIGAEERGVLGPGGPGNRQGDEEEGEIRQGQPRQRSAASEAISSVDPLGGPSSRQRTTGEVLPPSAS